MKSELPPRQPTLEDLLRVKRAERPPAEFWGRFEQELRAKQLAAIVSRRPWWQSMARLTAGRRYLPLGLGAGVAIALTLVAVRRGEPSSVHSTAVAVTPVAIATQPENPTTPALTSVAIAAPDVPVMVRAFEPATDPRPTGGAAVAAANAAVMSETSPRMTASTKVALNFSEVSIAPPAPHASLTGKFVLETTTPVEADEPLARITPPRSGLARFAGPYEADGAVTAGTAVSASGRVRTPKGDLDLRDRNVGRFDFKGGIVLRL